MWFILLNFLQTVCCITADGFGEEGSPVAVCITTILKKPLSEKTRNSLMKRVLRVDDHNVLHFMKNICTMISQGYSTVLRIEPAFFNTM